MQEQYRKDASYYCGYRDDLFPFIPANIKRSLDVGCGEGGFSLKLKEDINTETWGIEIDKKSAEIAKKNLDKVLIGSYEDVSNELPKKYFDWIFFNDVLEHMIEPEDCLVKSIENLSQDGRIMLSIPNMRQAKVLSELLIHKDWRYKVSGIQDKTHLRFYTKKSLMRMINECNYEIESIRGINAMKHWLITLANIVTFNFFEDTKYQQFLVIAKPKKQIITTN